MSTPFYSPGNPFGGHYMRGIGPGRAAVNEVERAKVLNFRRQSTNAGVGPLSTRTTGEVIRYAPNPSNTLANLRQRRAEGKAQASDGSEVSTVEAPIGHPQPQRPQALESGPLGLQAGPQALPPGPFTMPPGGRAPSGHTYRAAGNGPRPLNRPITPRPLDDQNVGMYDRAGLMAGMPVANQLRDRGAVVDVNSQLKPPPPPPQHRRRT